MRYCVTCGLPCDGAERRCLSCVSRRPMTPFTDPRGAVMPGGGSVAPGLAVGSQMLSDDEPLSFTEKRDTEQHRKRPKRVPDLGVWEKLREIG